MKISYRIRQSKIIYEILQTEVILVDFQTGDYYNLVRAAKQIWQCIEQHMSLDQIAQCLSRHYQMNEHAVLLDVQKFMAELLENNLIELNNSVADEKIPENTLQLQTDDLTYVPPKLQKYSDVQDLLLIDPIHAVSDVGWPEKAS